VTYHGTWRQMASSPATGGSITTTTRSGASVSYRFTGTGIAVVAPTSSKRGKVRVYIDGVYRATLDLRTSTTQHRRVVYARSFGSSGTHTITLRALGTTGRPMVSLDGFVVLH
jgi:Carbohydrate esterase 2 N-terminal